MSKIENNVTVILLTEGAKKLLAAMKFELADLPEEVNYLAFFEDGSAQYFETLDLSAPFVLGSEVAFVNYRTGVTLEF